MLPYSLNAYDILERFNEQKLAEITDDPATPTGGASQERIERAAADAAAELESYAATYYTVPLTSFPTWLRTIFLDLWAWRLLFNCKPDWLENERIGDGFSWSDRRKELTAWLQGLSSKDRKTKLPGCEEVSAPTSTGGAPWSKGGCNVMTRSSLMKL